MSDPTVTDEADRLRTLAPYQALGVEPAADFDRITALAARLFRVPVALVTLVDANRQYFKSHHGTDVCGSPSDVAFCKHALDLPEGETFIIPDATADARFADNPLVVGPMQVRFYAGAPLRAPDGKILGTLCLVDTVPRADLTAEERATLIDLAAVAMETFNLHLIRRRAEDEAAERQRAEVALGESESRLRRMASNCPGMIYQFVLEADGSSHFPFVGDGCRELFGIDPQAIHKRPERVMEAILPEYRARFFGKLQLSAQTLEPWQGEGRVLRPDGSTRWIQGIARPERLPDGRTLWNGVLLDMTARKRAEEEAERAASRVRTVLESITDAFFSVDREWRFTYVNDQAERTLGRSRDTLLGRGLWAEFSAEAEAVFNERFHHAMATGEPAHFEAHSSTLDAWLDVNAYPSEEGLSIYFQDITARRAAQRQLEDSHALLRTVIDGTEDAVFLKDRESRYLLINPAGAAFMGKPAAAIIGQDDTAFCSPDTARNIRERDLSILASGLSSTHEDHDIIAGVPRAFLTTKSPFRDAAGHLVGVIGIARDITPQREAAEALRQAKEEAEKANEAKSEFLSRMSHELRTPLNAILGFGQLLELGSLTTHQTESVEHILRAGRHLLNLIDEVLAISKIEAGRMRLSLEPVSLGEVARECLSLVGRLAQDRRVVCEDPLLNDCEGCEVHVHADRQRLRQVLLNLLSNAVKYNREGGRVRLNCREIPSPAPAPDQNGEPALGRVRIEVSDTGTGLSAEEIGLLFTPFERLRAERGTTEGTGLGLALSKSLVEAMNGRIGVDSVPGEGSTFWVELPVASPPSKRMAGLGWRMPDGSSLVGDSAGTILYIEDNLSNLRLIESLLGREKSLTLLSAQQGTLGIEIARARTPDLILLDLHLPDVPGWEVLAHLRTDLVTRDIPIIIISADATPHQIERLRTAGAQDYLTKPINVRELLRVLCEHLPHAPAGAVGAGV